MLGIVYLCMAIVLGWSVSGKLLNLKRVPGSMNGIWIMLPASFGIGTLFMTWAVYVLAYGIHVLGNISNPLLGANGIVMVLMAGFCLREFHSARAGSNQQEPLIKNRCLARSEGIFYTLLFLFVLFTMYYVFVIKDGVMYSGFTVYGDYAPHTAMMRSFSKGANFPTQYPHFGGEDVKYHFMFQFLIGNLEYLGMRLDFAYNLVSAMSVTGFLMLLGQIAYRFSHRLLAEIFTAYFFFFRSGTAFFRFVWEHLQSGDLWNTLQTNTSFIGYTQSENWGLWCYNVYLNQRHLAFALILAALAVWVFLNPLEEAAAEPEKGLRWIEEQIYSFRAWKFRDPASALMIGVILGLCAFWNGASTVGCLLILCGMAVFSNAKLDYLITAAVTILFSYLQTKIFMNGGGVSASIYFGFIAEDKSLPGVLYYLFQISGVFLFGLIVLAFFFKKRERLVMAAFLFPVVFSFVGSLTPDITVNHKYIMISWAFLCVFWAGAVSRLLRGAVWKKLLTVILILTLSLTGIYDFVIILKDNDSRHRVAVNLNSDLTEWLCEHLTSEDLILTPEYSMNEVTMSGVMMYCGWPYYAWSAGYDTYRRAAIAAEMYTTSDSTRLKELAEQEGITYILFDEGMTFEGQDGVEETIQATFPKVYTSENGRVRIYEV